MFKSAAALLKTIGRCFAGNNYKPKYRSLLITDHEWVRVTNTQIMNFKFLSMVFKFLEIVLVQNTFRNTFFSYFLVCKHFKS